MPEPSGDQTLPFHFAIWLAGLPPADPNNPPPYRSLPETASALLVGQFQLHVGDLPRPLKAQPKSVMPLQLVVR